MPKRTPGRITFVVAMIYFLLQWQKKVSIYDIDPQLLTLSYFAMLVVLSLGIGGLIDWLTSGMHRKAGQPASATPPASEG